jgi:hypothetical protein
MLQSSPFNYRRIIIWIGRLVLGAIFVYAGFAKLLMPNTHLWPYFFLKFSVSTNLTMCQTGGVLQNAFAGSGKFPGTHAAVC